MGKLGQRKGNSWVELPNGTVQIFATNDDGVVFTIDAADFDAFVIGHTWSDKGKGYARASLLKSDNVGRGTIDLQNYLLRNELAAMRAKHHGVSFQVDHLDRDPNNNCRNNLLAKPTFANNLNRENSGVNGSSKLNGVHDFGRNYSDGSICWGARFTPISSKKDECIGHFRDEKEAGMSWDLHMIAEYGLELMAPYLNMPKESIETMLLMLKINDETSDAK